MSFNKNMRCLGTYCLLSMLAFLVGCGATHTVINKRKLDVQSKMSSSVFLDPVTSDKKTLYLQVRNTSDKQQLNLQPLLATLLQEKSYVLVETLEQAHYLLQVNVLQVGRSDLRATKCALEQGFGAALGGAAMGAVAGSVIDPHHSGAAVGGIVGAAVATVADALVDDVLYCTIADVQISERSGRSVAFRTKARAKVLGGKGIGAEEVTSTEKIAWKRYQTRVVGTANKVNLKFEQALPELTKGLSYSIAGIF